MGVRWAEGYHPRDDAGYTRLEDRNKPCYEFRQIHFSTVAIVFG
jgi:hypothetical protein